MNLADRIDSLSVERRALQVAGVGALAAVALASSDPGHFSLAWRFTVFAALSPAVGCLLFVLIHRMTGGNWAVGLRPFLRAGVALLPWIWLLALPVLFFPDAPGRAALPEGRSGGWGYASPAMIAVRAVAFAGVFFALSWAVGGDVGRDDEPRRNRRPWAGPAGMLVLVFMLTLLADDWIASLEPGWHSTGFALVWMTGQALAGLSLSLLGALASGARPEDVAANEPHRGIDWGNLLMAALLSWCYVGFAQFLIIWAENLPAEISWFAARQRGPWFWVPPVLAVFGFLVPFLLLLSRRFKATRRGLAAVAVTLLLSQGAYTAWLILPAAGPLSVAGWLLVLALFVAGAGVFVNRFCRAARRGRVSE
jgi:hypothetical protein